jgi:hypothetical protein
MRICNENSYEFVIIIEILKERRKLIKSWYERLKGNFYSSSL